MSDLRAIAETTGHPHRDLLVEIDHVVFGYDASRTILNDVSLAFGRGKVTAILGGSGCGKTTLLRLIGGVYAANQGTIRVDGSSRCAGASACCSSSARCSPTSPSSRTSPSRCASTPTSTRR
jgi:ABC-type bacteriocin/lantibiotic exporter with double-glycine peptidase domain